MHYRRLGDAGMQVSAVGLGGATHYAGDDAARTVIEAAYEAGINFYDLADVYYDGTAEERFGRILKQFPRHTLVISSKLYYPMSDDVNDKGLSRKHMMESLEKSLKRLQTDYLDIYFCHRADANTPLLETAQAMHTLIEQGKILYWGTSEWSAENLMAVHQICDEYRLHKPKAEQPEYSMLDRWRVENQILPVTEPRGMGITAFSPLAMGLLTGKYDDGIPADSRFANEDWAKQRYLNDAHVAQVRQLKPIADELGITRAQLALAWVLRQSGVSSVIIGATRPEQVQDNAAAVHVRLSEDVLTAIDAILNG